MKVGCRCNRDCDCSGRRSCTGVREDRSPGPPGPPRGYTSTFARRASAQATGADADQSSVVACTATRLDGGVIVCEIGCVIGSIGLETARRGCAVLAVSFGLTTTGQSGTGTNWRLKHETEVR